MSWFDRHRAAIAATLLPGETLLDADRVIVRGSRRRMPRSLRTRAFVLVVTDARLVALRASTWLARPGDVLEAWTYSEGAVLSAPGWRGRLRLVLPDRSVVSLGPFGGWSVRHLAAHTTDATSAK